jgi:hypothetical protein
MKKPFRFFFHYNKPESKRRGKVIWSLHYNKTCYLVEHIDCKVPIETKVNNRQPYAIVRGWSNDVQLMHNNLNAVII